MVGRRRALGGIGRVLGRPQRAGHELLQRGVPPAQLEVVGELVGQARGDVFPIAVNANAVFSRLNLELSGYYLLSFEPTDADRTAKSRRIRVEVGRRGLTVRSRSTYAVADRAAAPLTGLFADQALSGHESQP